MSDNPFACFGAALERFNALSNIEIERCQTEGINDSDEIAITTLERLVPEVCAQADPKMWDLLFVGLALYRCFNPNDPRVERIVCDIPEFIREHMLRLQNQRRTEARR